MKPTMSTRRVFATAVILALAVSAGCRRAQAPGRGATGPGTENVTEFLSEANATLMKLSIAANQAGWVQDNFITVDTQAIAARATEALVNAATDYSKRAARFPADAGTPEEQRQLRVLKNTMTMAAPSDPKKTEELTVIAARMSATYRIGQVLPAGRGRVRRLSRRRGGDEDPGREPGSEAAARGVGRVAHHWRADEEGLRALRRAVE